MYKHLHPSLRGREALGRGNPALNVKNGLPRRKKRFSQMTGSVGNYGLTTARITIANKNAVGISLTQR